MEILPLQLHDTVISVITAKPPHSLDIISQDKRVPAALFHGADHLLNQEQYHCLSVAFPNGFQPLKCSWAFFPSQSEHTPYILLCG